jgi:hypothetical protein
MVPAWINRLAIKLNISVNKQNTTSRKTRASVRGDGNYIDQSTHKTSVISSTEPIPELMLIINGDLSEGKVVQRSKPTRGLVLEFVEICGRRRTINQAFNLGCAFQPEFPAEILNQEVQEIPVHIGYRTQDGQHFVYSIAGEQEARQSGNQFNIIFPGPSSVSRV